LNEEVCDAIEKWVKKGGVIIGEAYFAGWNAEHGHHEKIVPGYGLHKIFKVKQGTVFPINDEEEAEIVLTENLPYLKKRSKVFGAIVKETYFLEGAKVLAKFDTGEPAITVSAYGKGKAILIGSYVGLFYNHNNDKNNSDLIASLVEMNSNISKPTATENNIRIDYLTSKKEVIVIVHNLSNERISSPIRIPIKKIKTLKEQFTGEEIKFSVTKSGSSAEIKLEPKEVKVFYA
jgi:beta-galactosidase